MKLYYFPVAPNPTKVRLYLAEKAAAGADTGVELVPVDPRARESDRVDGFGRNPFAKLPVLELDDGALLSESLVILEYLEERCPEPPLVGTSSLGRARVRELERIAETGVLFPVARVVHATSSPFGWPPNPGVAEHFGKVLPVALELLDRHLADGRPFLAGDAPTIADCTLAAALQFARFGEVAVDPGYGNLLRWDRAYRERPPAREVLTH